MTKTPIPAPKVSDKVAAAFEAFLGSANAARFRQSDVAEHLYPHTRPRDHRAASTAAASLIRQAAKADRIERTEHVHWKIRPAEVTRMLRDGRKVPAAAGLTQLKLSTHCPAKWVAVDLETGQMWEGTATGWDRASDAAAAAVALVCKPKKAAASRSPRRSLGAANAIK